MRLDNILDQSEIWDEDTRRFRPRFVPRHDGWVPHGRYTSLREDGSPLLEITYRHGVIHGPYFDLWPNGKVACEGQFEEGKREGIWHSYDIGGNLEEVIHFEAGKEIKAYNVRLGISSEEFKGPQHQ